MTGPRILALGGVAAALAVSAACAPYEPLPRAQTAALPGVHSKAACVDCHTTGPPFTSFAWDTNCVSCHEPDRYVEPPAVVSNHFVGQGCSSQSFCHSDTDPSWAERLGDAPVDTSDTGGGGTITGFGHGFLPLQGGHPTDCTACHEGNPSAATVFPAGGTSELCWSCHEEDRLTSSHYLDDPAELPSGAEVRRDCKACHDVASRTDGPFGPDWKNNGRHESEVSNEYIRFPHGMEKDGVPQAEEDYVTACTDCHPDAPPATVCTVACHDDAFDGSVAFHTGLAGGGANDDTCVGCHVYADIRQD